jgi:putative two-component system response regulator
MRLDDETYQDRAEEGLALAAEAERLRGEEAIAASERAIETLVRVPRGFEDKRRAEALRRLAHLTLVFGGRVIVAVQPAALSVSLGRDVFGDKSEWVCRGLLLQGTVLNAVRNLTDGMSCFEAAYDMAQAMESPLLMSMAAANMGATMYELARYAQALKMFEMALELAPAQGSSRAADWRRASALSNIATCQIHLMDYEAGLSTIKAAVALMSDATEPGECSSRALAESSYIRLLLRVGRLAEAQQRLPTCTSFAERSGFAVALLHSELVAGLCGICSGQADIGLSRIFKAVDKARRLPDALRDALLTAIFALEHQGDNAGAMSFQREFAMRIRLAHREADVRSRYLPSMLREGGDINTTLSRQDSRFQEELRKQVGTEQRLISLALQADGPIDPDGFHIFRVGELSRLLAKEVGLADSQADDIAAGARLCDIGMVGVPETARVKQTFLDAEEREFVLRHTLEGALLIASSNVSYALIAELIARHHHERWDGNGYPDKLRGEAIPQEARIVALGDAFDVMTHERPYSTARSIVDALRELEQNGGSQFDPVLTMAFTTMIRRLMGEHGDLDAFLIAKVADMPLARARRRAQMLRAV